MRAVVTRVSSASVSIGGTVEGAIEQGFLVLLGVGPGDTEAVCDKLAEKICNLRVFEDENGRMNLSLEQVGGALLVVSQFTLYADTSSRRPGFTGAARPDAGGPPVRAIHGAVPPAGLPGGARDLRRGHAGGVGERRTSDHSVRYGQKRSGKGVKRGAVRALAVPAGL